MPKRADVHVSTPLTNLAIKYRNLAFVADILLPVVQVAKESDKYYIFSREEMREMDTHRAIGAPANEADWDVSTGTYSCEEYALKKLVADRIVRNADAPIRPKITTSQKLLKWLMLGYEKRVRDLITGGSLTHANPSPKWDGTSPTIEADIDTAKATIRLNAGVEPNILCMNDQVKDVVKKDSTVRNLIRYTIQGSGGQELLVNGDLPPILWGLKVVLAMSAEDTSKKGAAAAYSRIWPDDVLIAYSEPSPSLEALSLGYTFRTTNGVIVKTWRDDERDGEMIQPSIIQDEKLVATAAGYLLDDVLT
jgi:hypothetical protein